MTQSTSGSYYFLAGAADALATAQIGKLTAVLTQDEVAVPFTVLDCFDQSLGRSNRLLLETGNIFALFLPDGRMLSQTAKRNGQFVAGFQEGPIKQALADLSPLRSLLLIGSGTRPQLSSRSTTPNRVSPKAWLPAA